MLVKLRRQWFAPDISGHSAGQYIGKNGRVVARGHRLRKGIHEVPDEWKEYLPPDAKILDEDEIDADDEFEVVEQATSNPADDPLNDVARQSVEHAAATHQRQLEQEAEADRQAQIKENRQVAAAKARAAKKAKQEQANA